MENIMLAAGAFLLGATLIRLSAALYQTRRMFAVAQSRQDALNADFREQACLALATSQPERAEDDRGWRGSRGFRIAKKVEEAEGISSLYLEPLDGKAVPLFVPGQHLTLEVDVPGWDKPLTRCYSLSDAPLQTDRYRITVKRLDAQDDKPKDEGGIVSSHLVDAAEAGTSLNVRAPGGRFYLNTIEDRPIVCIAGGIGITPIMSMLSTAAVFRQPREAWLFYGVRNRGHHSFFRDLQLAAQRFDGLRSVVCYSQPTEQCEMGRDFQHRGRVSIELLQAALPHKDFVYYLCGPAEMIDELTRGLRAWGVPDRDIRVEAFGAKTTQVQHLAAMSPDSLDQEPARIDFTLSAKTLHWKPEDHVLLDMAEKGGIGLSCGCRAGQCGSCMVAVREGKVKHLVKPGVPLPKGFCLPCIAVPQGEVVLEA